MDNENNFERTSATNVTEEQATADTAEAEEVKNDAASGLGKFKSVEALLSAYLSLEAEFTRRSQRLKELEDGSKAQSVSDNSGAPSGESKIDRETLLKTALGDEGVKQAVIGEYLKGVSENRGVPLITGGITPAAPRVGPKTVREAGALAERFLKD